MFFFSIYLFSFCEKKTLACSREWLRMREAEAAAPPPKHLRFSIKRHWSSLPPPIPKDPADIPATSAIDHLSGGSSRRKFLAANSQHGPSTSPSTARGEPVDNAGDVCRIVDKFVATLPLSSDGFAAESLAAEEICLLRQCSSLASDFGPSEVVAAGTVPSSGNIPILLLFGEFGTKASRSLKVSKLRTFFCFGFNRCSTVAAVNECKEWNL